MAHTIMVLLRLPNIYAYKQVCRCVCMSCHLLHLTGELGYGAAFGASWTWTLLRLTEFGSFVAISY